MSVVFDFNDSLNDVAPFPNILFTVDKREESISDGILLCVFFLLSSLVKLSFVSAVFVFNNSPNDVAPRYPMLLPVDVNGKKEE